MGDQASTGVRWTLQEADSGVEVIPFLHSCGAHYRRNRQKEVFGEDKQM